MLIRTGLFSGFLLLLLLSVRNLFFLIVLQILELLQSNNHQIYLILIIYHLRTAW